MLLFAQDFIVDLKLEIGAVRDATAAYRAALEERKRSQDEHDKNGEPQNVSIETRPVLGMWNDGGKVAEERIFGGLRSNSISTNPRAS